jgi:hypothetical protein
MDVIFWSAARETKSGKMVSSRELLLLLLTLTGTMVCRAHAEQPTHFSRQWAVHIEGGMQVADSIATKHGFVNLGEVSVKRFLSGVVFNLGIINLGRWIE